MSASVGLPPSTAETSASGPEGFPALPCVGWIPAWPCALGDPGQEVGSEPSHYVLNNGRVLTYSLDHEKIYQ